MPYVLVRQRTKDADRWHQAFLSQRVRREEAGCTSELVLEDQDDPDTIFVLMDFQDPERLHDYMSGDNLRDALTNGQVIESEHHVLLPAARPKQSSVKVGGSSIGATEPAQDARQMPGRLNVTRAAPQMLIGALTAGAIWWLTWNLISPLEGMGEPIERLALALKCSCLAITLTFLTGLEAVSHERLVSDAFDPLAGKESRRLRVNVRYVQNTLEQLALFVPGLLVLAIYCDNGSSMRAVIAASIVWVLARIAFWVGYQIGPRFRVGGLIGMAQSLAVLLFVCARIGYDAGGVMGGLAPLALFAVAEATLVVLVCRT